MAGERPSWPEKEAIVPADKHSQPRRQLGLMILSSSAHVLPHICPPSSPKQRKPLPIFTFSILFLLLITAFAVICVLCSRVFWSTGRNREPASRISISLLFCPQCTRERHPRPFAFRRLDLSPLNKIRLYFLRVNHVSYESF